MEDKKQDLFFEKIKGKGKSLYIRINEASNGSKYLSLSQGRFKEGKMTYSNIFIFEDELDIFNTTVAKAIETITSSNVQLEG